MRVAATKHEHDDRIQFRTEFDFVRYANCWEDADILVEALQPEPGKRMLSIASSGDNSLALLAAGAEVVAADLNLAQLACLELRCAAFRHLDHDELLAFLGVRESDRRLQTYDRLQHDLSASAKRFWSDHARDVSSGIIHRGKFEAYFRTFRTCVLPLIHSRKTVARLLESKPEVDRIAFWNKSWNNWRWRMLVAGLLQPVSDGANGSRSGVLSLRRRFDRRTGPAASPLRHDGLAD